MGPSAGETAGHVVSREISRLLCKQELHKSPPLDTVLRKINLIHIHTYLCNIYFNIILISIFVSQNLASSCLNLTSEISFTFGSHRKDITTNHKYYDLKARDDGILIQWSIFWNLFIVLIVTWNDVSAPGFCPHPYLNFRGQFLHCLIYITCLVLFLMSGERD
jgi:hypothetical protein